MSRRSLLLAAALCLPLAAAAAEDANDCKLVKLDTSMGAITIALDRARAPVTVDNFVQYVKGGQYDGTIFHRVIGSFMIQGGGFTKDMHEKPTRAPIKNESQNGLKNDKYTVAMARTGVRDSATAQFFINAKDNDFLNYSGEFPQGWGHAVFGKVATASVGPFENVPTQPVVIEKARCVAESATKKK